MNKCILAVSGLKKVAKAIFKPIFGEYTVQVKDFKVVESGGTEYTVAGLTIPKVGDSVFVWDTYVLSKTEGFQNIMSQLIDLHESNHLTKDEKEALEWAYDLNIDLPSKSYTASSLDQASNLAICAWSNAYAQGKAANRVH
jgi:hypothetical protein